MDPALPHRIARTTEPDGDGLLFRFGHGLEIRTDKPLAADARRVLALGTPQATLMNYMLCWPERLAGRLVFEPFAGSGAIGLTALRCGARRVELLDVNPRAVRFARENAERNGFVPEQVACIEGSIERFVPAQPYELIFANPPFVPTPDGIEGTLTSHAGSEGNRLVDVLLRRLDALLAPAGEAFIYLFQFIREGRPLVTHSIERWVSGRDAELTPTQLRPIPAEEYFQAYLQVFPAAQEATQRWRAELTDRHGAALSLDHYVVRIGPRRDGPTRWRVEDDLEQKFGNGLRLSEDEQLALGRVFENFVPPGRLE
ncbi:MAG: RsmD family RNA methyltransferase [Myxococcota bacterium]